MKSVEHQAQPLHLHVEADEVPIARVEANVHPASTTVAVGVFIKQPFPQHLFHQVAHAQVANAQLAHKTSGWPSRAR